MLLINPRTFRTCITFRNTFMHCCCWFRSPVLLACGELVDESVGIGPYWLVEKYQHRFVPPCDAYLFPFMQKIPFLPEWCWFCLLVIRVRKSPYGCRIVYRYGYRYWYLPIVNQITVITKKVVLPPTHTATIIVWYNQCALFMLSFLINLCVCTLHASFIILSFQATTIQVLATPLVDSRNNLPVFSWKSVSHWWLSYWRSL